MASLKNLAGQTMWYGLSNIAAKFLNQLLTPIITYLLNSPAGMADYGNFSMVYSCISFANNLYTYGLETAYFRFASRGEDKKKLFQTSFSSLLISTVLLSTVLVLFRQQISDFIGLGSHTEYIVWGVGIVAIDTMAVIPFAILRQEGRPKKYAFTRVAGIVVNIFFTVFFIYLSPIWVAAHPGTAYADWFLSHTNVGFLLLANLLQAAFTFLLLYREWLGYRWQLDVVLWKQILRYGSPMLIVGLGGMVNETMDRIMLPKLLVGSEETGKIAVGIYAANYKLAIFITLFIQAFKMSAEPFFFSQSADKNAPATYARVMKWFVVVLCMAFLFTALYIDLWKYFIGPQYHSGLGVVPLLLAANVALGIYYNLSVWYKITDKMYMGMLITLFGATVTIVLNYLFIPQYGMYACAWATLSAYGSMVVISYVVGQRYFPVPYPMKKLVGYLLAIGVLYFLQQQVVAMQSLVIIRVATATVLFSSFLMLVLWLERQELRGLPVIGKYLGKL